MENPEALGFHQEQTETMEDSTEIPGLVLYQTLFYLLKKKSYYEFRLQYKNSNRRRYFNVSGNIIK